MAEYHLTRKAAEDLAAIWEYTLNTWSESQADVYYNELRKTFKSIVERPVLFDREYTEIKAGIYGRKCKKHIMFYKLENTDDIEIIRILHEKMDIGRRL